MRRVRDTPNVSSDGDHGLSGAGEEPGIGWKDGVRHLLRGEGQSGTPPTRPGTPTGRTPPSLGTQLWTCCVPASKGVSLSQCRCCFFCLRFHLAMCGRPHVSQTSLASRRCCIKACTNMAKLILKHIIRSPHGDGSVIKTKC